MEDKNERAFKISDFEELREIRQIYMNSLYAAEGEILKLKNLTWKYAVYNKILSETFTDRIDAIKADIKVIIEKLNNYKGSKIDPKEEKLKLDEIMNKLNSLEKKEYDDYNYYCDYLVGIAEKRITLKSEEANNIYVKTSEGILQIIANNYLKHEKTFLLFNDNINKLKNILNI